MLIPVLGQNGAEIQRRDFQQSEWRRATQGIDYSDDVMKESKPKEQPQGDRPAYDWSKFGGNAAPVLKVLSIILLVIALAFLIRSLLGLNQPRNRQVQPVLSVDELAQLDENLHTADLDDFIQRALAEGDFTLAIRLYYLAILKELSLQHIIIWKKDKTNRDYLREMSRTKSAMEFSEITLLFERIRYGNVVLQQADYEQLEPKFKQFIRQIPTLSNPLAA